MLRPPQIRKVWVKLAQEAVESGEFVPAKRYIAEVMKHCEAYDDEATAWHCQLLTGWMLFLEGEPRQVCVCALMWCACVCMCV